MREETNDIINEFDLKDASHEIIETALKKKYICSYEIKDMLPFQFFLRSKDVEAKIIKNLSRRLRTIGLTIVSLERKDIKISDFSVFSNPLLQVRNMSKKDAEAIKLICKTPIRREIDEVIHCDDCIIIVADGTITLDIVSTYWDIDEPIMDVGLNKDDGKEFILLPYSKGHIFRITKGTYATIRSPYAVFWKLKFSDLQKIPDSTRDFLLYLFRYQNFFLERLGVTMSLSAERRFDAFIRFANKRFKQHISMTHDLIGKMIFLTRETVTRTTNKLEKMRLIVSSFRKGG